MHSISVKNPRCLSVRFTPELIRNILDGREIQFTRYITRNHWFNRFETVLYPGKFPFVNFKDKSSSNCIDGFSSYFDYGDKLWVQESFFIKKENGEEIVLYKLDAINDDLKWKEASLMTYEESRILLEITNVSVRRLYNQTENNADILSNPWLWVYDLKILEIKNNK